MPTYQYACTTCDHRFEAVQSFTDEPLTTCPACDDGRLRKLFSAVGIVFKGSGFYRTDSRSGSTIPSRPESKVPATVGAAGDGGSSSASSTAGGSSTASSGTTASGGGSSSPASAPKP